MSPCITDPNPTPNPNVCSTAAVSAISANSLRPFTTPTLRQGISAQPGNSTSSGQGEYTRMLRCCLVPPPHLPPGVRGLNTVSYY